MNSTAEAKRTYREGDVSRSKHVLDAVLSRAGSFCIYQLSETVSDEKCHEERQLNSLWRVDLMGAGPRRLTAKGRNAVSPQITPDGRFVLYLLIGDSANEVSQVHRLPLDGGEAEPVTSMEQGVASFALSPDGRWVAFAARRKALTPRGLNDHVRIDRLPYRFDSTPGFLQDVDQAIYIMPAEGGEYRRVTTHDGLITAMSWSPDGNMLAAMFLGRSGRTRSPLIQELYVIDADGGARKLRDLMSFFGGLFWTADGMHIGCAFSTKPAHRQQLYLVDRKSGAAVSRTASLDLPVGNFVQSSNPAALSKGRMLALANGRDAVVPIGVGGEVALYRISLSGAESCVPVVSGPKTCIALDTVGEILLFAAQDFITPSQLRVADLRDRQDRALVTQSTEWLSDIAWPRVDHVVVRSVSGNSVEGWVFSPPHGERPSRTILFIHGGPHATYGYSFNEDFHELVGAGYAVAFANPRGSLGYGDAFSAAIVGRWGDPELEDLNAFLDELVSRGLSDPARLGVTGLSAGGYLSAWLIGHTDRFRAAVPEQGVYNLVSMYGTSDAAGLDLLAAKMGGEPHELVLRYWEHSPIAYAHTCRTPTLLIQGEEDVRCPMEQAEQLFAVLKYNGCKVELLRLKGCNHALETYGPPPLRRARMNAIKDWFGRYLP